MSFLPLDYLRALRGLDVSLLERALLTELALRADESGCSWPSPTRIARDVCASKERVRRARLALEKRGLICRVGTVGKVLVLKVNHPKDVRPKDGRPKDVGHKDGDDTRRKDGQKEPRGTAQEQPPPTPSSGGGLEAIRRKHGLGQAREAQLSATIQASWAMLDDAYSATHNGERSALVRAAHNATTNEHSNLIANLRLSLKGSHKSPLVSLKTRWISAAAQEWSPTAKPTPAAQQVSGNTPEPEPSSARWTELVTFADLDTLTGWAAESPSRELREESAAELRRRSVRPALEGSV